MSRASKDIEERVTDFLTSHGIYPFSVVYIDGLLKVCVYLESDIQDILGIINYQRLCDTTGIDIYPETILFSEMGLQNFMRYVDS